MCKVTDSANTTSSTSHPKEENKVTDQSNDQQPTLEEEAPVAADDASEDAREMLEREKREKKKLARKIIEAKCKEQSSEFPIINAIGDALTNKGDSLELAVLSGGETNFSYKAFLRDDPAVAMFCKLTFTKALWNPNPVHYDLDRVDNEFLIMNRFAEMFGGHSSGNAPVAQPYYVIDIDPADNDGNDAKLLMAEWSATDEQFANQFTDGRVDSRVIQGLAEAIAKLNLTEVEDEWNQECRECFRSLHPVFKQIFGQFVDLPEDQSDPAAQRCKQLGIDALHKMIDALDKEYMESRQVLNHNDTKQFNILVEPSRGSSSFGPSGDFAICDWEMSIKGKAGKDLGVFIAFPIACLLCHAAQGNEIEARDLLDTSIVQFWNDYENAMVRDGDKDEEFLVDAFRGMFGGAFLYLHFAYYAFGMHNDALPLEGLSNEMTLKAKGAMGAIGLWLGEESYGDNKSDLSLEGLKNMLEKKLLSEIDALLALAVSESQSNQKQKPVLSEKGHNNRRRTSSRRASDAMMMEEAMKRISQPSTGSKGKRASIYDFEISDIVLQEIDD